MTLVFLAPRVAYAGHPPGPTEMLTLVAYDISHPKRLTRVAGVCEDFGVRVQYSLFECRLEPRESERFWQRLLREIDPRETRTAGTRLARSRAIILDFNGVPTWRVKARVNNQITVPNGSLEPPIRRPAKPFPMAPAPKGTCTVEPQGPALAGHLAQ